MNESCIEYFLFETFEFVIKVVKDRNKDFKIFLHWSDKLDIFSCQDKIVKVAKSR